MLLVFSCKKKETPPPAPEPSIEFISVSPSTLVQFNDQVIVKIKYKDANGDLGDLNPDEHSMIVKDDRLQNADTYHIQPLAPISEENIPIEGELTLKLNSMFLIGTGTSETTTLRIKLKDRAGNWSNEVSSTPINITK